MVLKRRVIAHRGLWHSRNHRKASTPNSVESLIRAEKAGFGVESDFRDGKGSLVIAHNPDEVVEAPNAEEFLHFVEQDSVIAANLKSTGVAEMFPEGVRKLDGFFFFDMPFPEALLLNDSGESIALRVSEYESVPDHLIEPKWVWLDYWQLENHLDEATSFIRNHESTRIVAVSPELHGLNPHATWKQISEEMKTNENLYICTDYPEEFLESFNW